MPEPPPSDTDTSTRALVSAKTLLRVSHLAARPFTIGAFAIAAALSFAIGSWYLKIGQPAEDAYILYRYAVHVAQGLGIVFNPSGPRAEGATDFLWLLSLAGLNRAGMDVAVAALAINALGAGIAAAVLAAAVGAQATLPQRILLVGTVVVVVVTFHGALAAYQGFSALLFSGLAVTLPASLVSPHVGIRRLLPGLALLVALVRPDGVILAGATFLLAVGLAYRDRRLGDEVRRWAPVAALGAVYFAWRYWYFGLPLPLPLYVKSRPTPPGDDLANGFPLSGLLPSLRLTWLWFQDSGAELLAAIGAIGWLVARRDRRTIGRETAAMGAFGALLMTLARAHQVQNVEYRFQAPVFLALVYFAIRVISVPVHWRAVRWTLVVVFVLAGGSLVRPARWSLLNAAERGCYVDEFAPLSAASLGRDTRVALTEAGRLPFWWDADVLDADGLNTPQTAVAPVSLDLLARFDPDVIMFHHARTMSFATVPESRPRSFELTRSALDEALRPSARAVFDQPPATFEGVTVSSEQVAALVLARFLRDHAEQYRIFAVDYCDGGSYFHLYGFRKEFARTPDLVSQLQGTLGRSRPSAFGYAAARELARR